MPIELRLRIIDKKTGKVEVDKPAHSFVKQFLQLLCADMKTSYVDTITDTGGNPRAYVLPNATKGAMECNPVAALSPILKGIVVGSSNVAQQPIDIGLNALIAHGSLANQLKYSNVSFVEAVNVTVTISIMIQRTIQNDSPGVITVREVGLYNAHNSAANLYYFCTIRDVVADVVIAIGAAKIVQYILQMVN